MVVARASGTDLASILSQNTFLILSVHPWGVRGPRGTGGHGGPRDGGTRGARDGGTQGARDGGTRGARDGGTREGQFKSTFPCGGTSLADPEGVKAI